MAMPWSLPGANTEVGFTPDGALTLHTMTVTSKAEISFGSFGNELWMSVSVLPFRMSAFHW